MRIESVDVTGGKDLNLEDGAGLEKAVGIAVALMCLVGFFYHFGRSNVVGIVISSAFVAGGCWVFLNARSYTVRVDSARRQVRVDVTGLRAQSSEAVAFDRIAAVEYHDRRRVPRLGKSHLIQRVVLRLDDGTDLALSGSVALLGSNKDQAARCLAAAVGKPFIALTEPDYE